MGLALVVSLGLGVVAHELAHALALRLFGVPVEMTWLPERSRRGSLRLGIGGRLAVVTPQHVPRDTPPWRLRVAAMMPLLLATPLGLVALGVLGDPTTSGNPHEVAVAIGWLACAVPSPQDFAVLWHAREAIERSHLKETR